MTVTRANYSAKRLFAIVDAQGRRHDWLADQLGYDTSYISHLKSGARPITQEIAEKAARVLGVPAALIEEGPNDDA